MAKYRDALPQLGGGFFLTDGGIEATLIFPEGLLESATRRANADLGRAPELQQERPGRCRSRSDRADMAGRWLRYCGAKQPARAAKVHKEFCECFYPGDPKWRAAALEQSKEILDRGIAGIGG